MRKKKPARKRFALGSKRQVNIVAAICGVAIIAGVGLTARLESHASSVCQKLLVPAYVYPSSGNLWDQVDASSPVPNMLILDISGSGAGTQVDPTFVAAVDKARNAGIDVIGYDDTTYGSRAVSTVESEVRNYKAWYGVTNIFFDQISSSNSELSYYQTIYDYVHSYSPGSTVVINPGDYPSQSYMSVGDVLMVFEGTYAQYVNATVPSWAYTYPASRFAHTIYATSGAQWANALYLSQSRNAGYVYITDGSGGNPYNALPAYWSSLDASIAAGCRVPTPTPSATPRPTSTPTHAPTPTGTPKPTSTPIPTAKPSASPSSSPIAATPTPSSSPNPTGGGSLTITPSEGNGSSASLSAGSQLQVSGTITLTSGGNGKAVIKIDGTTVSTNGQFDTTYLPNGTYKVAVAQNGTTVTRTIVVKNKLSPLQSVRNTLFAGFHGDKTAINFTLIGILIVLAAGTAFAVRRGFRSVGTARAKW
jgi:hypothetical protein